MMRVCEGIGRRCKGTLDAIKGDTVGGRYKGVLAPNPRAPFTRTGWPWRAIAALAGFEYRNRGQGGSGWR